MKPRLQYNQIAGQKLQRMEALSDGVFAVALTLLVLDIKVPVSETIKTEQDLLASLCALMPKILTYFLSFMTLGIFWMGQSVQLNYMERYDRNLNWLSLFFLLAVSVIPFSTAFLSEHIHFKVAIAVYWANIFCLGASLYLHWRYAMRHNYVDIEEEELETVSKAVKRRIVIGQALYAIGALLCFVNTYLSIAAIILVQANYATAIFSRHKKPHFHQPATQPES